MRKVWCLPKVRSESKDSLSGSVEWRRFEYGRCHTIAQVGIIRLDNMQWFKKLRDPLMNMSCFKRIPKSYEKRTLSEVNLADEEPSENKITSR